MSDWQFLIGFVLLRSRDDHQHGATMTFSLDLNQGAPKGARGISELIDAHIDAALLRARSEEEKRTTRRPTAQPQPGLILSQSREWKR